MGAGFEICGMHAEDPESRPSWQSFFCCCSFTVQYRSFDLGHDRVQKTQSLVIITDPNVDFGYARRWSLWYRVGSTKRGTMRQVSCFVYPGHRDSDDSWDGRKKCRDRPADKKI